MKKIIISAEEKAEGFNIAKQNLVGIEGHKNLFTYEGVEPCRYFNNSCGDTFVSPVELTWDAYNLPITIQRLFWSYWNEDGVAHRAYAVYNYHAQKYGMMYSAEWGDSDMSEDELEATYKNDALPYAIALADKFKSIAPNTIVYLGKGTGFDGCHEVQVFVPYNGTKTKGVVNEYGNGLEDELVNVMFTLFQVGYLNRVVADCQPVPALDSEAFRGINDDYERFKNVNDGLFTPPHISGKNNQSDIALVTFTDGKNTQQVRIAPSAVLSVEDIVKSVEKGMQVLETIDDDGADPTFGDLVAYALYNATGGCFQWQFIPEGRTVPIDSYGYTKTIEL